MEKTFENINNIEALEKIEKCKTAIKTYIFAMNDFSNQEDAICCAEEAESKAKMDCEYLASDQDGVRLGAPCYGHVKLRYDEDGFFLDQNRMDDDRFKKWELFVGEKFEEKGLKFRRLE